MGETGFIAEQQQSSLRPGFVNNTRPLFFEPLGPAHRVEMVTLEASFLIREAQLTQQSRDIAWVESLAELGLDQLGDQGGVPQSGGITTFVWASLKAGFKLVELEEREASGTAFLRAILQSGLALV